MIAVLGLLIFSVYAAAGPNANAVLSLDLIADGGAGNGTDDGITSGTVSGRGTTIAIEIFATGVRTSLIGVTLEFDFDASLLSFVKAENSAFSLTLPEGSTGTHLATRNPVTLASSGFLARAEFTTVSDVAAREFSIGIESVTLAESTTSSDELITTSVITFNASPSPDFDGDDFVGFTDFLIFASVFGSQQGDGTYDARIDLNSDGSIGFTDFLIFAQSFGSAPPSTGGGSPDLVVQSPSVSDNNVASGATFTLGATVRNQGNGSSAATTLHYYRSDDATVSSSDTEVGTDAVDGLAAGRASAESIDLAAPSDAGTYYYGACVDAVTGESDTGNNCSAAVSITVAAVIPTDDRAALVALYEATDGLNWTNKENWLSATPLDEWYGVTTDSNGRVTVLNLRDNNLQGTLPVQLARLTNLRWLNLYVNQLTGTIPTQLGRLINLTSLYLGFNKLSGAIPTELGRLTNLEELSLDNNHLTGPIPTELGRLSKLTWLELQENQLTGTIPTQLGQLTNLTYLELGGNTLTGPIPVELGQLTKLTRLYLYKNQLTGTIPTQLGQLTKLTNLQLNINKLSGAIPKELGQLTKLTNLWLNVNKLSGTIPPELARLTSLTELVLSNNAGLSGPLPPAFTDLTPELVHLGGTGVCLPLTEEFVEWKESIPRGSGGAYCADPEREALIAFYKQTNGPNWKNKKNWSALAPLGEWYGVTTDADGRVTQLNLEDNDLSGLLPPTLSSLANLKTLNLAANPGLSGPLPQVFTRLPLESLDLEGTRLCAPPRAEFQTWLDGIRDGDVSRCTDVRPDFYALVALYSRTDGPNWKNATNWTSAAPLDQWYGVTTDGSGRVTGLSLNENDLQGTIPVELGQLTNLDSLNLSGNQLTGNVPQELGQLTNLKGLNLSGNEISGNIPLQLVRLTNLESLNLAQNELTGEIPTELGQLTNLSGLNLGKNQLTGKIPTELGGLTNLRTLDLSDNPLDGEIPSELGQLTNLESLTLWFNSLTGEIPPELGRLTNLRTLYLVDNFFTGNIPPELGQLTNLEELWIINNTLTGEIPQELGQLTNLKGLNLQFNQLTGSIPTELGQLTNLQRLSLSTNQLTGNIPPELGQLTNLTTLNLRKNQLSGNIPPDLGQITDLQELYLSTNQLTGNIPPELGRLTYLRKLNLSANQLTGNIPPELGQLTNLTSLNLAFNGALSGTLPAALTGLTLETLILHETLLCSPQDAGFQQWMRAIPVARVPNCARSDEAAAYLVQATQSLEYPVPLVAGEPALLRVFVTADREVDASMPPVQATFYRDGVEVHTAEIGGQAASIPWQVNEASLLNSANAMVPGSVVMPGLEMVVEIDPDQTLDSALGVVTRMPRTGRTPLDVRSVPPFDLTLVPFLWEENPDRSVLTQTEGLSSESDLFRLTRDILPVREFRLKVHEPVMTSVDPTSDGVEQMGPETELIYAMEGAKGHYMAIFRSVGESGLKGIARLPGFVSLSILDANTIAHELGHNLNLAHAPGCGAGFPDPDYPYEDGAIGAWGYDFVNESLVSPATSDLMTYCDPQWISDYSFSRALAHRYQGESAPLAAAKTSPTKGLLVWGGLTEDNELFLEPAFVVSAPPSLPRIDGPYTITGEDEHGNNLFSLPFGMPEYGCGARGGSFAFILPVHEEWPGRLARIALSGPEGVSILDGEDDPSATLLLDRATGDVRGILRDWPEAAAKRPAASLGLTETELEVLTSNGIPDAASWER